MTEDEPIFDLKATLGALGWSKAKLARRLGLHRNTVSGWETTPVYAREYLALALEVKRLAKRV